MSKINAHNGLDVSINAGQVWILFAISDDQQTQSKGILFL